MVCLHLHADPSNCEEGSLRLVDGVIDNEGRVEVCLHGVWGIISSDYGWSSVDAYFVCNQLKLGISKSQHNEEIGLQNFFLYLFTPPYLIAYLRTSGLHNGIRVWRWNATAGHEQPHMLWI